MLLSRPEFDVRFQNHQLALSLIGMSGMGKTYRSRQLTELGFRHLCCDDLIAEAARLPLPAINEAGLAAWMAEPYSEGYPEREQKYLEAEEAVTRHALLDIKQNTLIDTTGSVIYLSNETKSLLKRLTLVVYLQESQALQHELFETYLSHPKPVVWGKSFNRKAGESQQEALQRCYPELLKFRARKYKKLADLPLPFAVARDEKSTSAAFLEAIRERLKVS